MQARRCLLVLDNLEAVLQPNEDQARYREGCAGYGVLLDRLGAGRHQTCLLLTSREAPLELGLLEGAQGRVRTLELAGLGVEAARAVLQHAGLSGDEATWAELVERYGGNGLALKIAGENIRHFFGGDVASFLIGFSKELLPFSVHDGEVIFTTQLGHLIVKAHFLLKEMLYHDELAV